MPRTAQSSPRRQPLAGFALFATICGMIAQSHADNVSTAATGIDSRALLRSGLSGTGIAIGQVEPGRPGLDTLDSSGEWFRDVGRDGRPGTGDLGEGSGLRDFGEPYLDVNDNGRYDLGYINYNLFVKPAAVFVGTNTAPKGPMLDPGFPFPPPNAVLTEAPSGHYLSFHAEMVAGVMISRNPAAGGVAPGASLYSGAFGRIEDISAMLTAQHIASRSNGQVRAVNLSFGLPLEAGTVLDGSARMTAFLDWSTRREDVLYVVGGNQDALLYRQPRPARPRTGIPVPTDEYNGLTVGMTRTKDGVFGEVDPSNFFGEDAAGPRRSLDLLAPGANIRSDVLQLGSEVASGTSFAAPHVTGTIALLQQHAEARIAAAAPMWDLTARNPMVMRAVLMNSANKIRAEDVYPGAGAGDRRLLGMTKTLLDAPENFVDDVAENGRYDPGETYIDSNGNGAYDAGGQTWLQDNAYTDNTIPLDDQMGTGQLDASRALAQFSPGRQPGASFGAPTTVPVIGWDFGFTDKAGAGDTVRYAFGEALLKDSFVSVTLAWDRAVLLNDTDDDGDFDAGETFRTFAPTNMDLFLFAAGANRLEDALASSVSTTDTVEHIFFRIPRDGAYEFWVRQTDDPVGRQHWAAAWWAVPLAAPVPEPRALLLLVAGWVALLPIIRRRRRRAHVGGPRRTPG